MFPFQRHSGSRTVRLRDGTPVVLRQVRRTDLVALRAFVRDLSPESRYLRFHGSLTGLSDSLGEYLVSADGQDHVAVVAWIGRVIVGVGRYIRFEHAPEKAEIAFAVADAFQRRGLGSLLRDELIATASRSGIRSFRAVVMAANRAMRPLLRNSALRTLSDVDGVIEVALDGVRPVMATEPLSELDRAARLLG
jgi:GNAT superfamily N-acetyltransferase